MKCTTQRVNPNTKYELWLIMLCQCRFIYCNIGAVVVGDGNDGGGYELGLYGKSLYAQLNFPLNLKLVKKSL